MADNTLKEIMKEARELVDGKKNKLSEIEKEHDKIEEEYLVALQVRQEAIDSGDRETYAKAVSDLEFYQGRIKALEDKYDREYDNVPDLDDLVNRAMKYKRSEEAIAMKRICEIFKKDLKGIEDNLNVMYRELYDLDKLVETVGIDNGSKLKGSVKFYSSLRDALFKIDTRMQQVFHCN